MGKRTHPRSSPGLNLLLKHYISGPAAFGSAANLAKTAQVPLDEAKKFLTTQTSWSKYGLAARKFPCLKTIAYRINEIWSVDLAYVDKLAKYNGGVMYLLVAVDVLSRYVRVQPLKDKTAKCTLAGFKKMLKKSKVKPEKVWTDKGTEFKAEFKAYCEKQKIHCYSTHSETKSAYAERQIRSLKNIIYKYLEFKWSWKYIDKLDDFVRTINTRVNRTTKLAPYKVTKKDVPRLVGEVAEASRKLTRKPKYKIGDKVRISHPDLPFKKGYKQTYTDEIFTIVGIPTTSPPTYNLVDDQGETVDGKIYERELQQHHA